MKIEEINNYRDGGSISILLSDVDESILKDLGLPTKPKYIRENSNIYVINNGKL